MTNGLVIELAEPQQRIDGSWIVAIWVPVRRPDLKPIKAAVFCTNNIEGWQQKWGK